MAIYNNEFILDSACHIGKSL